MAKKVLIIGRSGSGKSTSLRNFKKGEVAVINLEGKDLPFKSDIVPYNIPSQELDRYKKVTGAMDQYSQKGIKAIVVDDVQNLLTNEMMVRAGEKGYDKWLDIAQHYYMVIDHVQNLPEDVIVYFMSQSEVDTEGFEKIRTVGKMLDEKVCVEGMFTIVLKTDPSDACNGNFKFRTMTNGKDIVKSPMGMFESAEIDNDLKVVDETIRAYYGI